ncbi:hypothetical protein SFRURICE_013941 [Spodoptera frugiperda]|nr:hypothetical protein SFRURICE_013941 [Spodoptera frugiperda]
MFTSGCVMVGGYARGTPCAAHTVGRRATLARRPQTRTYDKKMAKDLDTHRPSEAPRVYHYTFEELTKDATDLLGQPSMNRSTDVHHVVVLKPKLGPSNVALHVKQ